MVERQRSGSGALGLVSVVLAVLGGALTFVGAWIPGGFLGVIAVILGFVERNKARSTGTSASIATLGLALGALVLIASVVLIIMDS